MSEPRFVERIWFGRSLASAAARTLLAPAEGLYAGIMGVRGLLYDVGWLGVHAPDLPAISIGNLTVGGTGKTPIAAWIAAQLRDRGITPGIVLRGYGNDEPLVHRVLNPGIPVVVDADRIAGIAAARKQGARIAVLDDAFQHRRAGRACDIVLVSADRWSPAQRLLPAGPWREPLRALRRASHVVVTRKAVDQGAAERVHRALAAVAPTVSRTSVHLAADALVCVGSDLADATAPRRPLRDLAERPVTVITAVADPSALIGQLEGAGARVSAHTFPDHHAFSDADVAAVARTLSVDALVVCTLKDAVKLAARWPRMAPPLWYVSQRVIVERGVGGIERMLDELAQAGPTSPRG